MKTLSRWLGLLLLTAPIAGCDEGLDEKPAQQVYFEVSHHNSAWGTMSRGFLIDKDGRIRKYDTPDIASPAKGMSLTSADIAKRLSTMVIDKESIAPENLQTWVARINSIADSAYSKPVREAYDAGITSYYAYRYDPVKLKYSAVLLRQSGDEVIDSRDKAAMQIAAWLNDVSGKIYR